MDSEERMPQEGCRAKNVSEDEPIEESGENQSAVEKEEYIERFHSL
jgi:hypothetical protein